MTFGQVIAQQRKALRMSQKGLADSILKEDGTTISPQYLNDIEHDRRSPSSDHLIREFARVLGLREEVLYFHAGQLMEDLRDTPAAPKQVVKAFAAFRKALRDE